MARQEGNGALTGTLGLATKTGGSISRDGVLQAAKGYESYHSQFGGDVQARKQSYTDMVNKYYDLATSFYEYGWGESFHFAHRLKNETLRESIKRHEHYLALKLKLEPNMKVLDVGCGIGGPLREIAAFSGASIVGLNNNAYQISRGEQLNRSERIFDNCSFLKADFMHIPVDDNSFDSVYAIEATCHAPDAVGCYSEILRVLKPGQLFAAYEWCLTDSYDPNNPDHKKIKEEIEIGNGLPDIRRTSECVDALIKAGFEVVEAVDLARTSPIPWYDPLSPKLFSISHFRLTTPGKFITRNLVSILEFLRIAPVGSSRVSQFLEKGADGLVEGGQKEVFTPLFFLLARKPLAPPPQLI